MIIRSTAAIVLLGVTSGAVAATKSAAPDIEANWSIETGLGYETNAYHAPDHDYADYYADPTGGTIVTPEEKGGFYIPLKFETEMSHPISTHIDAIAAYRFDGNFHPDSALQDANSTKHQLSVGTDFKLGKKGDEGKAYAGAFAHTQDKVYVDRDSGEPKISTGGIDVSNRYTYTSYGLEGDYERKITDDDSIGIKAAHESLNYSDPVAWTQYDHTYTMYGAYWEHKFPTDTRLTLEATKEVRDYRERLAYNIDGSLFAANPVLKYNYTGYALGVRQRFNKDTTAYFDYEVSQRRDTHVGYNDLNRTAYKVRIYYDVKDDIRLRGKITYYDYDYLNAYNFEDPAQGDKKRSATNYQIRGDYKWNKNKTYYVELEQNKRDNTDDRYQYNNTLLMLGAKWDY